MTCAINDYSNLHERCIDVEILYLEKSKEFRITLKYEVSKLWNRGSHGHFGSKVA